MKSMEVWHIVIRKLCPATLLLHLPGVQQAGVQLTAELVHLPVVVGLLFFSPCGMPQGLEQHVLNIFWLVD